MTVSYFSSSVRRLFSSFASGWPGAGILLLRMITGTALVGPQYVSRAHSIESMVFAVAAMIVGLFLIAGLWTPVSGCIVVILEVWRFISQPGDLWTSVLIAGMGASLALIGPGRWSLDARLFGWKRIDLSSSRE